jgi:hypothetical protein
MKARIPNDPPLAPPDLLLGGIRDASGIDKLAARKRRNPWSGTISKSSKTPRVPGSA